ncbi:MAG: diguanylate cyclase [Gammaproteobacteria bacterium]|nr:diguanylate cyclase [Gammaproteobacteria bacterium]
MSNILTSGFVFEEGEDLLRFRFRMFNIMLLIIAASTILFALLHSFGVNELGDNHARTNYFASALCLLAFFWLRQSKASYRKVAVVTICAMMLSPVSALLFVPDDEFRLVWFLITVIVSHLVVGRRFGLFIVALSILIVLSSNYLFGINFTGLTLSTFIISLLVSSLILISYNEKITSYEMELFQQNKELKDLVNRDALTGIMSRRYFLDMANHYFSASLRNRAPISLIMLDIDHFKQINDSYGHYVGDQMLNLFSETISGFMRQSDIFGRIGGEEFGIVLFETDTVGAQVLAEKLLKAIEEVNYMEGEVSINMTTSIGVGERLDEDSRFEQLMIRTDRALYQSKDRGRNCISLAN